MERTTNPPNRWLDDKSDYRSYGASKYMNKSNEKTRYLVVKGIESREHRAWIKTVSILYRGREEEEKNIASTRRLLRHGDGTGPSTIFFWWITTPAEIFKIGYFTSVVFLSFRRVRRVAWRHYEILLLPSFSPTNNGWLVDASLILLVKVRVATNDGDSECTVSIQVQQQ